MKIISGKNITIQQPQAITIGKFDALHLGHIALIKKTIAYAKKLNIMSTVITFHPSPITVLHNKPYKPILDEEQKIRILSDLGIDILVKYPFDKTFANISPDAFVKLLFEDLQCHALVVGENFRFGRDKRGETSMLANKGKKYGVIVDIVKNIELDGTTVSSSYIRKAIENNNIQLAERLLGRVLS